MDAQNVALSLGVGRVDYAGRVEIARVCNDALALVQRHGMPMPAALVVRERFSWEEGEDPNEFAYYLSGLGEAPGEIYINAGQKVWTNIVEAMRVGRSRNFFSTNDPRHIVMHELGEMALHQSVGWDRYFQYGEEYLREKKEFRLLDLDHIRGVVSDRAAADHGEFVAEVFAALMLGRDELRQDGVVMGALRRFGDDAIVRWTRS